MNNESFCAVSMTMMLCAFDLIPAFPMAQGLEKTPRLRDPLPTIPFH